MCEHDDLHQFAQRSGKFSRRQFGAMALGDAAEALEKAGRAAELAVIPALWQQFNAAQAAVAAWLEEQASCQASA